MNETGKPANLQFNYNGTIVSSIKELEGLLKGTIAADATEKTKTYTINWLWNYETGSTEEQKQKANIQDTRDGKTLDKYNFNVVVTGRQVEPV